MQNFQYYNPTRLIFGQGSIEKIRDVIPLNSKILMLYGGGSIFKNGVYDQVKASLPDRMFVEFKGIEANPRYETLMNALDVLRSDDFDFILAVGGGSVIDGAKFISAAYYFDGDPVEILKKRIPIRNKAFPYGTVLTLPATGSEMNSGSVVTIEATQEKLP